MSITQLYPGNFKLVGRQRKTMNISLTGNVLVLYIMRDCRGCQAVEPIFRQLSSIEPRVKYAICDLTDARDIIAMSHQTKTQIQKVPYMILYCDCRPHARFKGEKNIPALRSFICKALAAAPAPPQQGFMQQQGNMYSGGGGEGNYNQQQIASQIPAQYQRQQQIQGGPGQGQGNDKFWMPELGKTPTMTGALRGGTGNTQYAYLGTVDDVDEEKLLMPDQVIPHNEPWMAQYKKLGTMD
uniref:Thioredoxin-like protein n=1 Tax=Marseillevirus LCMAC101 TaxID=2506602 RepID=A0A481YSR4_9VIRU|nr:MAG: thioredoxin-like protein [Marseillevirus LCMAC101]